MREQAKATGRLPPALENIPQLPTYLDHYHDAYNILHASRQEGFSGFQPITFEAMDVYCRAYDVGDVRTFFRFMQAMDVGLLGFWRKKGDKET